MDKTDRGNKPDQADSDPRPAAVTFVTTEHFTLQGARSSTISESTGRASVFLGAVSGGLIALGLVASAAKTGVAFYMFGLILLPTLAFVGLATFHRVLQSGIEDLRYARRIAQLLKLLARRNVEVGADGREVGRVAGDGGLRDDDRPDREQSAQPCPQWVGLLTVVQEHQPHPHLHFPAAAAGTSSPR
jgi:hypothetical protein